VNLLLAFAAFLFVDCMLYVCSPFPARVRWHFSLVPGGGIAAFVLLRLRPIFARRGSAD